MIAEPLLCRILRDRLIVPRPGPRGFRRPRHGRGDDIDEHVSGHPADTSKSGLKLVPHLWICLADGPLGEHRKDPVGE